MADDQKKGGFLSDLFAPVGGFGVTFATMFRKVATTEYPEVKRPTAQRFHGRIHEGPRAAGRLAGIRQRRRHPRRHVTHHARAVRQRTRLRPRGAGACEHQNRHHHHPPR